MVKIVMLGLNGNPDVLLKEKALDCSRLEPMIPVHNCKCM
jgi:hypothetical protein